MDYVHRAHVYTLFEKIFKQELWELHEIEKKITCRINALSKSVLSKNVIRESRAIKYPLTNYDTAQIWHGTFDKMAGIFTKGMWQPYA